MLPDQRKTHFFKKVNQIDIDNWKEETLRWEETLPKLRLLHAARLLTRSLSLLPCAAAGCWPGC